MSVIQKRYGIFVDSVFYRRFIKYLYISEKKKIWNYNNNTKIIEIKERKHRIELMHFVYRNSRNFKSHLDQLREGYAEKILKDLQLLKEKGIDKLIDVHAPETEDLLNFCQKTSLSFINISKHNETLKNCLEKYLQTYGCHKIPNEFVSICIKNLYTDKDLIRIKITKLQNYLQNFFIHFQRELSRGLNLNFQEYNDPYLPSDYSDEDDMNIVKKESSKKRYKKDSKNKKCFKRIKINTRKEHSLIQNKNDQKKVNEAEAENCSNEVEKRVHENSKETVSNGNKLEAPDKTINPSDFVISEKVQNIESVTNAATETRINQNLVVNKQIQIETSNIQSAISGENLNLEPMIHTLPQKQNVDKQTDNNSKKTQEQDKIQPENQKEEQNKSTGVKGEIQNQNVLNQSQNLTDNNTKNQADQSLIKNMIERDFKQKLLAITKLLSDSERLEDLLSSIHGNKTNVQRASTSSPTVSNTTISNVSSTKVNPPIINIADDSDDDLIIIDEIIKKEGGNSTQSIHCSTMNTSKADIKPIIIDLLDEIKVESNHDEPSSDSKSCIVPQFYKQYIIDELSSYKTSQYYKMYEKSLYSEGLNQEGFSLEEKRVFLDFINKIQEFDVLNEHQVINVLVDISFLHGRTKSNYDDFLKEIVDSKESFNLLQLLQMTEAEKLELFKTLKKLKENVNRQSLNSSLM